MQKWEKALQFSLIHIKTQFYISKIRLMQLLNIIVIFSLSLRWGWEFLNSLCMINDQHFTILTSPSYSGPSFG